MGGGGGGGDSIDVELHLRRATAFCWRSGSHLSNAFRAVVAAVVG